MVMQYLIGTDGARLPDGIAPVHTLYGEPDNTVTHAYTATAAHGVKVIPIAYDGIPYVAVAPPPQPEPDPEPEPDLPDEPFVKSGALLLATPAGSLDRAKRCVANDDTCMGWRINGSELCSGHAGKLRHGTPTQ